MTKVVCDQLSPRIADFEANQRQSVLAIRRAAQAGADIVVLPELVTSGYVFDSRAEAESVAVTPTHPIFADWSAAAEDATVVAGFCEKGDDGNLYNSAAVVDRTGVLAVYRKTHLWDREKLIFEPGDGPPPVVDTRVGRIGVLICYDLEFPEMTRTLALAGAELIAVPTNWPLVPRPPHEHPPEVIIAMAAARTNKVFIACCDRTGAERGQQWTEGTAIIDESGWVIATTTSNAPASVDIDLTLAKDKALTELSDVLQDRRPELYANVVAQRSKARVRAR